MFTSLAPLESTAIPPVADPTVAVAAAEHPAARAYDTAGLYREYAGKVFRWARRLAGSPSDAEDIVQEVFLVVHRRQHMPGWVHNPGAWLLGVTFNAARHVWRKRARSGRELSADLESVSSQVPTPLEQLEARRAVEQVEAALASLTEGYREIYWLCEIQQIPGNRVAELMGVHPTTVRVRRFRARAQVAEWLAQDDLRSGRSLPPRYPRAGVAEIIGLRA